MKILKGVGAAEDGSPAGFAAGKSVVDAGGTRGNDNLFIFDEAMDSSTYAFMSKVRELSRTNPY